MGVVAICVALAAWKIIAKLTRYESNDSSFRQNESNSSRNKKVLCPLCVKRVNERSWRNGRHRTKCARKYEAKITNDWPVLDPAVTCPICSKSLRKMSASRLFRCSLCPSDSIQIGCFLCDFNLCQACVNHQRAQQLIEVVDVHQSVDDNHSHQNFAARERNDGINTQWEIYLSIKKFLRCERRADSDISIFPARRLHSRSRGETMIRRLILAS